MAEARFVSRLKAASEETTSEDWFSFKRSEYNPAKVLCVDKVFVKGVGTDRSTNDDQMDYTKVTSMEGLGLRQYVHKYDLGMQDYYFMNRFEKQIL